MRILGCLLGVLGVLGVGNNFERKKNKKRNIEKNRSI